MIIEVIVYPDADVDGPVAYTNELRFKCGANDLQVPRLPDPGPFASAYNHVRRQATLDRRRETLKLIAANIANALGRAMEKLDDTR